MLILLSDRIQKILNPANGDTPPRGWFDPGNEVVLNGSDISSIRNQAGNVTDSTFRCMAQPVAVEQPLYVASGINGLPSIRQTIGQNESLFCNFPSSSDLALFAQFIFRPLSKNTAISNMMGIIKAKGATNDFWILRLTDGLILEAVTRNHTTKMESNKITDSTALVIGNDYIIECRFDPSNDVHSIMINGVVVVSGPAIDSTPPNSFGVSYPGLSMLSPLEPGNPPDINALYSELFVQDSIPSISETDKRRQYLADRFKIRY